MSEYRNSRGCNKCHVVNMTFVPLCYFLVYAILDFVSEGLTREDPTELGYHEEFIMFTIIVKSNSHLDNSHLTKEQVSDYLHALVEGWGINIFDIMVLEEV